MAETLEALVGQQLIVGIPGTTLGSDVAEHLRALHIGGFIPFERNWTSPAQFLTLVTKIHEAVGRPVLVMIDHEGGRIVRFRSGVTAFPAPLALSATRAPDEARAQGAIEARELAALGVHLNLAPCVDVLSEGCDPVIGDRSYGADPTRVAAFAVARIEGLQGGGIAACAKHFPGLGEVPRDPHRHLPTVSCDWARLRSTHLVPFQAAIHAGVATVMSSHVCYPRCDPSNRPATFSPRLIHDLLRQDLGFTGVLMTDDMEMGALRELCPIGEAAVRAVEAGHDMVLVCATLQAQRDVFDALCAAYRSGRLPLARAEEARSRIEALRKVYNVGSVSRELGR